MERDWWFWSTPRRIHGRTSALRSPPSGAGRGGGKAESPTGRGRVRSHLGTFNSHLWWFGRDGVLRSNWTAFNTSDPSHDINQTQRTEIDAFKQLKASICSSSERSQPQDGPAPNRPLPRTRAGLQSEHDQIDRQIKTSAF